MRHLASAELLIGDEFDFNIWIRDGELYDAESAGRNRDSARPSFTLYVPRKT